jgi:ATP-dependent RNA helicase DDX54/DBP10
VEYVVIDEADRCFEMGLASQLNDILLKLPQTKQMALFSATMPTQLVEFAKVGLHDPEVIRLDADTKISPDLKIGFFTVKSQDKPAALLYFLRYMVKRDEQTIVFVSTRHHVEFLHELLTLNEIESTILYGTMDPTARKIGIGKFKARKSMIMIVTDLAARGIDIPLLETVINYDFPPKPKVYVHRVGRTARNGMPGCAYSFVSNDEIPYMLDLLLFLGRPLNNIPKEGEDDFDGFYGSIPVPILDDYDPTTQIKNDQFAEVLRETSEKAFKLYYDTRPSPSAASLQRAKTITNEIHPIFLNKIDKIQMEKVDILSQIKGYKPNNTVFDLKKGTQQSNMMTQRRKFLTQKTSRAAIHDKEDDDDEQEGYFEGRDEESDEEEQAPPSLKDLILDPKKKAQRQDHTAQPKKSFRDERFFITGDKPVKDQIEDQYYSLGTNLDNAVFDLGADETKTMAKNKQVLLWDVKKKKYVRKHLTDGQHVKNNKIINESGVQVQKDGKTHLYSRWRDSSKKRIQFVGETEDSKIKVDTEQLKTLGVVNKRGGGKNELKSKADIDKIHKSKEKQKKLEKSRETIKKWGMKNFKQKIHLEGMVRKQEQILSKQRSGKMKVTIRQKSTGGKRKR